MSRFLCTLATSTLLALTGCDDTSSPAATPLGGGSSQSKSALGQARDAARTVAGKVAAGDTHGKEGMLQSTQLKLSAAEETLGTLRQQLPPAGDARRAEAEQRLKRIGDKIEAIRGKLKALEDSTGDQEQTATQEIRSLLASLDAELAQAAGG